MTFDLLIHNGTLVTVNPDFEIIENGFVGINDRLIMALGSARNQKLPEARKTMDAI